MNQRLEDRLTSLAITPPPDFVNRVLARAQQPARRGSVRRAVLIPAMAAVITLALLGGSLYCAPRFAEALASAPLVGGPTAGLLRSIGMDPINGRLTPIDQVSNSSGYRVELIAGYADASQTVLVVRVSPTAQLFETAVLSDQYGRSIQVRSGVSDSRTGNTVLIFEGLPWPDQALGARLTFRAAALQTDPASGSYIRGSWILHATLAVEPSRHLGHPADGRIGISVFHFNSIVRSGPSLEVDMQVNGPLSSHLTDTVGEAIPNVSKPHPAFKVALVDASGSEVQTLNSYMGSGLGGANVRSTWLVTKAGRYRIVISFEGAGHFERLIEVPS